jgi:hypothetical protein
VDYGGTWEEPLLCGIKNKKKREIRKGKEKKRKGKERIR